MPVPISHIKLIKPLIKIDDTRYHKFYYNYNYQLLYIIQFYKSPVFVVWNKWIDTTCIHRYSITAKIYIIVKSGGKREHKVENLCNIWYLFNQYQP